MIPPEASAEFVFAMEQTLDLYQQAYNPQEPLVCFDETSKQLLAETRMPLPMQPGEPLRYDTEYERRGTANLFMFFEPLANWRHVEVTDRRTMIDFASCMKALVDDFYPEVDVIHVVLDNLNTHKLASLYEAFSPEEAHRMVQRLRFHHTPKHGSWLNMAEIELSILSRQTLAERIADRESLEREIQAWEKGRNDANATIDWQFTTKDARIKLKRLYPSYHT